MNTDNREMCELTGSEVDLVSGGTLVGQVIVGVFTNLLTDAVTWAAGKIADAASDAASSASTGGYMLPGSHYGPS